MAVKKVEPKKKVKEVAVSHPTMDEYIKEFTEIKNKKEALAEQTKELNRQEEYLEGLMIEFLQGQGLTKASSEFGTASIKEEVYPAVEDWKKTLSWIVQKKEFQLLPKKVNSAAWRELHEMGQKVPGVEAIELTKLSFRRK